MESWWAQLCPLASLTQIPSSAPKSDRCKRVVAVLPAQRMLLKLWSPGWFQPISVTLYTLGSCTLRPAAQGTTLDTTSHRQHTMIFLLFPGWQRGSGCLLPHYQHGVIKAASCHWRHLLSCLTGVYGQY